MDQNDLSLINICKAPTVRTKLSEDPTPLSRFYEFDPRYIPYSDDRSPNEASNSLLCLRYVEEKVVINYDNEDKKDI